MVNDKKTFFKYLHQIIFTAFLVCVYGLAQHMKFEFPVLHQNFTGNATFGNPNFTSEYIGLVFPMTFFLIFAASKKRFQFCYSTASIVMAIFLLLNKSRAVWIGTGLSFTCVIVYLLILFMRSRIRFHGGEHELAHGRRILRMFVLVGVFVSLIIGLSFIPFLSKAPGLNILNSRVQGLAREAETIFEFDVFKGVYRQGDTMAQRILIWRNTLGMIRDNSILGVGIGNFKIKYQPYRTEDEQKTTGPDVFVRRSHNEHIQLLSEVGLFGSVFFYWMIGLTIFMSSQLLRSARNIVPQCVGIGFMGSFISMYVAMFFNFSLQTPTPCLTLFFFTGLLMAAHSVFLKSDDDAQVIQSYILTLKRVFRAGLFVLAIACFILPIYIVRPAQAYYCYQYGQALEKMGLYEKSESMLERSLSYCYYSWETHFVIANVKAMLAKMMESKYHHEYSLKLNPYHQKGHYNLGNTLYKIGEADNAIEHYKMGIEIDSIFYQSYNNLASILYKEGRYDESVTYFRKVVELNPNYREGQYNLAFVLGLQGKYKEAFVYAQNAYKINPRDKKAADLFEKIIAILQKQGYKVLPEKP